MPKTEAHNSAVQDADEKGMSHHLEKHDTDIFATVDQSGAHSKTQPAEIRLVRKLDWVILPMLWIMYWFNYLDRNAITVARLDNLEAELGLSSTEYQTCVSILFAGYILGQVPSSTFFNASNYGLLIVS